MERLNLCASAIRSFRNDQHRKGLSDQDRRILDWLCRALLSAVKFILPDGGRIMDEVDCIKNADLMRLPYPVTALEYRMPATGGRTPMPGEIESRDRIALCFSPTAPILTPLMHQRFTQDHTDDDGFYVMSIFKVKDVWFPVPMLQFIDTAPEVRPASPEIISYLKSSRGYSPLSRNAVITHDFLILPLDIALEPYARTAETLGDVEMARRITLDIMDEMNAARQFCVVLNCRNVVQQKTLSVPYEINEKRLRKGKLPLYDYHVLTLDIGDSKETPGSATPGAGTGRAAPRQHLRRGHIRRLEERIVWVNSTIVGNQGFVSKDYSVRGSK